MIEMGKMMRTAEEWNSIREKQQSKKALRKTVEEFTGKPYRVIENNRVIATVHRPCAIKFEELLLLDLIECVESGFNDPGTIRNVLNENIDKRAESEYQWRGRPNRCELQEDMGVDRFQIFRETANDYELFATVEIKESVLGMKLNYTKSRFQ